MSKASDYDGRGYDPPYPVPSDVWEGMDEETRVLIATRNLAAKRAAELKAEIAELHRQLAEARKPGPATKAMIDLLRPYVAEPESVASVLIEKAEIEAMVKEWES